LDFWKIERNLHVNGYYCICGVDEAGRGPLAGPVYTAAVILPFGIEIAKLNDSKKLPEKVRESLYDEIICNAESYAVAFANHDEVDKYNILNATFLAMNRAIAGLSVEPDICLIDGNRSSGITYNNETVTGGDGLSASIAAASILAKVNRDRFMIKAAEKYPHYAFEKHKGYGTKLHYERLRKYGPCEIHRISFLQRWLKEDIGYESER